MGGWVGGWCLKVSRAGLRVRVLRKEEGGRGGWVGGRGGWVEEVYTLGGLPVAYHAAYRYAHRLVEGIRALTPRMTLFLLSSSSSPSSSSTQQQEQKKTSSSISSSSFSSSSSSHQVVAKCMLMENGPLPDFRVRWADGAVLRYSLKTGYVHPPTHPPTQLIHPTP